MSTTLSLRAGARKLSGREIVQRERAERENSRLRNEPRDDPIPRAPLDQVGDLELARDLESRSVDHDKVRALRDRVRQPELVEAFEQDILALVVLLDLLGKEAILLRLLEADGNCFLRGTVAAEDDAGLGGQQRLDEVGGSDRPADAPSRGGKGLALVERGFERD